jgi:hypothetical protein
MNKLEAVQKLVISLLVALLLILPVSGATVDPSREEEGIRAFSRFYEFDYVTWTLEALGRKLDQASLGADRYLAAEEGRSLVLEYLSLRSEIENLQNQLSGLISNPAGEAAAGEEDRVRAELSNASSRRETLAPLVESQLQLQLDTTLSRLGVGWGGQPLPPVLYRSEPDSYALIVSPRAEIRQQANIMLVRDLTLDQIIRLEGDIERDQELSALVVGIGGVGLYPSMIIDSSNLDWLVHVIGHEWTHNYLTLRPLGLSYGSSPEITTINETVADLSADDIQQMVFQLYYPEYLPPEPADDRNQASGAEVTSPEPEAEPVSPGKAPFDFQAEMHETRLEVDRLLAEGRIETAEAYMEARRQVFWDNGYQIRRLNQAYFAFHGSYAADPGGAASQQGADLGALLRELKANTDSYPEFMRLVAWRWRLDQFQALFDKQP